MKLSTFIAENAGAAVQMVQNQLGPEAIIVNVRKLPQSGLSRLLNRGGQIEVTACVPGEDPALRHSVPPGVDAYVPFEETLDAEPPPPRAAHQWRSINWLESLGLLPEFGDRLALKVRDSYGPIPPQNPIAEWDAVRMALATFWRPTPHGDDITGRPHVFIGPPGSGKTTVLCKWLTSTVLRGEHRARVCRADGETANTAEFLSLHCEMIGVPIERFWMEPAEKDDLVFVDIPGVEPRNFGAIKALREILQTLPAPHIHLVLNAAYETQLLFEQFNAFAPLMPEDLIFTHLDEEVRRVKLWNFVLGTNCSLGWLAGGQKIPGTFQRAETTLLFPHKKTR